MTHPEGMTIGKLAKHAGVGVETIRFYQNIGLLEEPPKPKTGYRHYPQSALERLRFIKRAQELSFSLKEISQLLRTDPEGCAANRAITAGKLESVRDRIKELHSVQHTLEKLVEQCERTKGENCCQVAKTLMADT